MTDGHCFISYSNVDALEFATRLANELEGDFPPVPVWFDKRKIKAGHDWGDDIAEGIKTCKCFLYVLTKDSTTENSVCKQEWDWALRCKKPIIPIHLDPDAELPFRLGTRQWIEFQNFEKGFAKLRNHFAWMDSPDGKLYELNQRLLDAQRALSRVDEETKPRIQTQIEELQKEIANQQELVNDPEAAKRKTEQSIKNGLERERKPEAPITAETHSKFINPPPGIAPNYFQDRSAETKLIADFLNNDAQRISTIVGRAGVGKTAMICRLLKALEAGQLPDDLGEHRVNGIVYLGEAGSHKVNFANIFTDLSKLLPRETAAKLESLYKDPKTSIESKTFTLMEAFRDGQVILLLDNFESLIETENIRDAELNEALNAFLCGPHHTIKIILTTRIAPHDLNTCEPGRQYVLRLDEGLETPHAENMLKGLDADSRLGIKNASMELLSRARVRTRGYPRALEALAGILSADYNTTLEELIIDENIPLPDDVVKKLVGDAFSRLDPTAQKVMQALGVYGRPVTSAAVDYLLQPHVEGVNSAPILQRLVNMHFARREAGRFYLHPVDKEYAISRIPHGEEIKDENPERTKMYRQLGATHPHQERNDFTKIGLTARAADYFAAARKPRADWKKLDDLSAQLAEFELRCEAGDYDTAASVLTDFDFDYLLLWGHYRLAIEMHIKVTDKINDPFLQMANLNCLGLAYQHLGDAHKSIVYFEKGIHPAQDANNRQAEGAFLGNLANTYSDLGDTYKAIEFYEQALAIAREIGDHRGEGNRLGNLGNAYSDLGDTHKAIEFYEQALAIAREIGYHRGEGIDLGLLGSAYKSLGEIRKALDYQQQALAVAKEIGDKSNEGNLSGNIGNRYLELGEAQIALGYYRQAVEILGQIGDRSSQSIHIENIGHVLIELGEIKDAQKSFQEAIGIANEILFPQTQNYGRWGLAQAYLFQNDLVNARATIEAALQYDVPENNHNASALHGIIALRGGERKTAQEAFAKSLAQADEILAKTPEYYDALDAKGLALCGRAVSREWRVENSKERDEIVAEAVKTFKRAREIAPHAGVVKSVLRLFDELVKCDEEGVLKDVRSAVEGVE